jgi:hypothetical protein
LLNNNATKFDYVALQSVLNLARVVSSAAGFSQAAALVYSDSTPWNFSAKQAYHWQGLSASAATYHPFTSGTVTGTPLKFNGDAVNCSEFSQSDFWTDTGSMGLTDPSWNFDSIADGYLPSLNGQFVDTPFSCMNEITYPEDWNSVTVSSDFEPTILPSEAFTGSAHYFIPAQTSTDSLIYRFNVSDQAPFDIFYNGTVAKCQMTNRENWQLPAAGLFLDSTISLRASECSEADFEFNLSESNHDLLLSWTASNAQSVSVVFTMLTNLAGGDPPGISAAPSVYEGSETTYTWNLGPAYAGTYVISVSGSVLWTGKTQSFSVGGTLTWTDYLQTVTEEASISFPDVFTGSARTVTYKNDAKVTVSRVPAVNASRYEAIRWLGSVGVTVGSQSNNAGKTTFRPQDSVNRGAMALFLQKLAGFTYAQIAAQYQGESTKLTDITSLLESNPARYYAILWLADTGITAGCNSDGTQFCPDNPVNRGAMAEFMRKFAGVTATPAAASPFPDVNLTDKNVKYDRSSKAVKVAAVNAARMGAINWMQTTEITLGSGTSGGVTTYRPQDPVNRGAMAEFMRRLALLVGSTK